MTVGSSPSLYVVVLALDECQRIGSCVRSAAFADRVIVVDSGSTDGTITIARELGAEVHVHADWHGFGEQRNRALRYCDGADYVFFLDADEEVPPALRDEIQAELQARRQAAWLVGWNQVAFGRPLSGMDSIGGMPRLFHAPSLLRFEGAVHEHAVLKPDTPVLKLRKRLLHHSYDSVERSLRKISQYAMLGATKRAALGQRGGVLRGLASAMAAFIRLYFFKRAFLHGGPGFLFCYVYAQECFFRHAALRYDRELLNDRIKR